MAVIFLILLLFAATRAENVNKTICNEFQANFDVRSVTGTWYVVAIIPEKLFPESSDHISCYKVEFSETDKAGLRWLVNSTLQSKTLTDMVGNIKGTIIRQRYFSDRPYDVWAKNIGGVKGCFQQILVLDIDKRNKSEISSKLACNSQGPLLSRNNCINFVLACKDENVSVVSPPDKPVAPYAMMQLHVLDSADRTGPFLLQMLWGKMVSVVIYRRKEGVTQEQLKPAFEFMSNLRGPQRIPRICEKSLKDIINPHNLTHF